MTNNILNLLISVVTQAMRHIFINIATSYRIAKTASTTMLKIVKRAFLSQMAILASVLGSTVVVVCD